MSLSVIPLTILGQITGVSGSGDTALYEVRFKSIDGTPLYGVTAVWTNEQAEIEALAAQKSYGVWINPISGEFTVKFAGYTYIGSADLTDPDVLAGITPIEFNNQSGGGSDDSVIIFTYDGENYSCNKTLADIVTDYQINGIYRAVAVETSLKWLPSISYDERRTQLVCTSTLNDAGAIFKYILKSDGSVQKVSGTTNLTVEWDT